MHVVLTCHLFLAQCMLDVRVYSFIKATGTVFDVECRDSKTGDGAFLTVTSSVNGKTLEQLSDAFLMDNLIRRDGRLSFYGSPTDVKITSSQLLMVGNGNDNDSSSSGMSASLICTGYDHELHRGVIYTINKGGLLFEETYYSCLGSGSTYIIGHLDSYYNTRHRQQRQCLLLVVVLLYC